MRYLGKDWLDKYEGSEENMTDTTVIIAYTTNVNVSTHTKPDGLSKQVEKVTNSDRKLIMLRLQQAESIWN